MKVNYSIGNTSIGLKNRKSSSKIDNTRDSRESIDMFIDNIIKEHPCCTPTLQSRGNGERKPEAEDNNFRVSQDLNLLNATTESNLEIRAELFHNSNHIHSSIPPSQSIIKEQFSRYYDLIPASVVQIQITKDNEIGEQNNKFINSSFTSPFKNDSKSAKADLKLSLKPKLSVVSPKCNLKVNTENLTMNRDFTNKGSKHKDLVSNYQDRINACQSSIASNDGNCIQIPTSTIENYALIYHNVQTLKNENVMLAATNQRQSAAIAKFYSQNKELIAQIEIEKEQGLKNISTINKNDIHIDKLKLVLSNLEKASKMAEPFNLTKSNINAQSIKSISSNSNTNKKLKAQGTHYPGEVAFKDSYLKRFGLETEEVAIIDIMNCQSEEMNQTKAVTTVASTSPINFMTSRYFKGSVDLSQVDESVETKTNLNKFKPSSTKSSSGHKTIHKQSFPICSESIASSKKSIKPFKKDTSELNKDQATSRIRLLIQHKPIKLSDQCTTDLSKSLKNKFTAVKNNSKASLQITNSTKKSILLNSKTGTIVLNN